MQPDYRVADHAGNPATLYDTDIIAWANRQAALLRAGRFTELDIEHVADEIEDVARSEQRELGSRMAVLLAHLIKWRHQPERRGRSWQLTIRNQRHGIERRLARTPSLKHSLCDPDWWADAWADAFGLAFKETGLDDLPESCPWPTEQILNPDWLPD
ncbi:DUF29 domain-containing protein [Thiohalocapsa sp. ML1]|uniref:DUF29 domain-containing protein n=1 Tax=Thiohalocapsa sp. ML1 TaxID=1431688 RepID=UPI000731F34D|nr:DUF29 domain-containing protein [Thiohalocapsa sp. ML1]